MRAESLAGCLLGTAVGDALGLPYEGLSAARAGRLFPDRGRFHLLPGYGLVSDDTEHACFTAQALVRSGCNPETFEKQLARSLRWWLLGLPAGIGLATARATFRLWAGMPPSQSGVDSAGNGPAMRSPLLGVAIGNAPDRLSGYVLRSTRITHTDRKAFYGALAVAVAAAASAEQRAIDSGEFLRLLKIHLTDPAAGEFLGLVERACRSAQRDEPVADFAAAIGSRNGISGYSYHTVPCVIQAWLRHQRSFTAGVTEIIAAGGDTDSTAAILGGILGAGVGKEGIPAAWRSRIVEWPRSLAWMEQLADALDRVLDGGKAARPPGYFVPGLAVRNAAFLLLVLAHGFRRLLPPY